MASYIPGLVLQKKNTVYVDNGGAVGAILEIPTPDNGAFLDGDVWAIPVNYGVYSGWTYLPYNLSDPTENTAPTPSSVACTKVSANNTADWYIVLGTSSQYITAVGGGTALPIVWPFVIHTTALLPVCQTINTPNPTTDLNEITIGLPSISGGETWYPFGFFNGVALPTAASGGYSTTTSLLVFLNASWSNVGTWTATSDSLTVILTQSSSSTGKDVFCGGIVEIIPSL